MRPASTRATAYRAGTRFVRTTPAVAARHRRALRDDAPVLPHEEERVVEDGVQRGLIVEEPLRCAGVEEERRRDGCGGPFQHLLDHSEPRVELVGQRAREQELLSPDGRFLLSLEVTQRQHDDRRQEEKGHEAERDEHPGPDTAPRDEPRQGQRRRSCGVLKHSHGYPEGGGGAKAHGVPEGVP